jgi:hypothetical protein
MSPVGDIDQPRWLLLVVPFSAGAVTVWVAPLKKKTAPLSVVDGAAVTSKYGAPIAKSIFPSPVTSPSAAIDQPKFEL